MSKKALLIGVAVTVVALGVIGAAFATGMDFSNVGALSSGKADVVQINTDDVGFLSCADGVYGVVLSFDRDLTKGSTIWVTVEVHGGPKAEAYGWKVLDSFLDEDDEVEIELDKVLEVDDIGKAKKVTATVAER